ncbi:urease accessory protein UreD [Oricola indica]|uniref:urease accessory protein UreD n=1 Tax=Oricola indica TaxID=2872591 RepID=UPI001CBE7145|nr:urease accessory protein UreD [Oricola indica]
MNEGYLSLRLKRDGRQRTRLSARRQSYPLTTTAVLPMAGENTALIYVQNAAGSIFGGDKLRLEIALDEGAELCLSTPTATRLNGTAPSVQETCISVGSEAFIEVIPDMIIPHGRAHHQQITRLEMKGDAGAIIMDLMAPGRVARGERHDYALVSLRLEVSIDGRPILVDAAHFCPSEADPWSAGALGDEGYVGTVFVLGDCPDHATLGQKIAAGFEAIEGIFGGAAPLASGHGVVARFLADDATALRLAGHAAWDIARRQMRDRPAPVLRK